MLVLGGCRSGKSRFAAAQAGRYRRKLLIATMEPGNDTELADRIRRHREERGPEWQVLEEPVHLDRALAAGAEGADVVVVDCLTLWVTNCLLRGLTDEAVLTAAAQLADMIGAQPVPVILVANEVGLGIVPDHPLARRFRDLAGWINQRLAAVCGEVYFVAAGLPLILKQNKG